MGIAGRIARYFQSARITPLLALVALLMGLFAATVTPREEEPQINVTMANVIIPFPGAPAHQVEQSVAVPAEQVLGQMAGLEHVMSLSRPGLAIITVQFKVGVPRTEALVRLYDTLNANRDWLPAGLGVGEPIVKPKGIDDVPILTATLYDRRAGSGAFELERIAHTMEAELKRVAGTREVRTIGGPGRAINIVLDAEALRSVGLTIPELRRTLQSANSSLPAGSIVRGNDSIAIDGGGVLENAAAVSDLIVGVHAGRPVFLRDIARVSDGAPPTQHYVWYGTAGSHAAEYPAVTLSVTKKPGENAVDVARRLRARIAELEETVLPQGVGVEITRDYGATANDKALKLIEKLLFATASVVALVFFAMGRREAAIVGIAVALTLTATLFASWAWGFTLNRVSLFALIFSIGILVDDAIVVVENIHRHQQLDPDRPLADLIPGAVDEVGGPTILATFTVIAALLPMAFVSGLMGPYMAPIPINASMGMLISLAVAFVVTPWLARLWLRPHHAAGAGKNLAARLEPLFRRVFAPFLDAQQGQRNRRRLWAGVGGLILIAVALPAVQWVVLKMLPFDNKSEFQLIVDLPAGAPVERTAATLGDLGRYLATVPEVHDYQAYAGVAAPINFNGLVRQYYLRAASESGDIQVNLVGKGERSEQSHAIATRLRPALAAIGRAHGAIVKLVEVPPGPPVLAPIVAEIYGPDEAGRLEVAAAVRAEYQRMHGVVDVDASYIAAAPRQVFAVDRARAALLGVSDADVVATLRAGIAGEDATYLQDASKYPAPLRLQLADSTHGSTDAALDLGVRSASGALVPIGSLLDERTTTVEQPLYHKDLLPVVYVTGDMAGRIDSPLYGMFGMRQGVQHIVAPDGGHVSEFFIHPPSDPYRGYALKWDGEWQITYETFRDMGAAYAVGLVLIYLLVVAQFGSYIVPLVIMAPIPLTIIGVMPGHALLRAPFTATSMIGMIALAGIIVRNSILLVDFINLQLANGIAFGEAVVRSAATRAQPIALTAIAAMLGATFILDDPIFNGLAISLIFGILVSTVLTLVVIPLLYYAVFRHAHAAAEPIPNATDEELPT
ncbi:MAG TPA: efflux RND transporter permease subunit [Steroidobacteraceae bacterium]|nr:efflux RND transporter permease subunit [Steroidobacteraceae bacterium]